MKLKDIREGWMNYFRSVSDSKNLPIEIKRMSEERAETCKTCPELKPLLKGVKIGGPIKGRCGKCGCAFPQLVFAPGKKCPLGKW